MIEHRSRAPGECKFCLTRLWCDVWLGFSQGGRHTTLHSGKSWRALGLVGALGEVAHCKCGWVRPPRQHTGWRQSAWRGVSQFATVCGERGAAKKVSLPVDASPVPRFVVFVTIASGYCCFSNDRRRLWSKDLLRNARYLNSGLYCTN